MNQLRQRRHLADEPRIERELAAAISSSWDENGMKPQL
jgi:hypothetical protein